MKTLGIIGGLGPETTANFYMGVISAFAKKNKLHRPSILITNVPVEFELEEKFINQSKGKRVYRKLLINAAKMLENGGADFIVIPCNSVHLFIDEVEKAVNIPVLSIVDETINHLKKNGINSIGILATPFTFRNKLFNSKLKSNMIKFEIPTKEDQKKLGIIINKILQNKHGLSDKEKVIRVINKFSSESILLACTDLHILLSDVSKVKILDTMQILKNASVRELIK
ncbi:MAG: amino acid racemase [Candidatus Levybacteria bacterium]|nr:amino acid racemase [Candidatus Levybacteria bacterium]